MGTLVMRDKVLSCLVLIFISLNSVHSRPRAGNGQVETKEPSEEIMKIEGMERRADGNLYFNGEKVKSISTFGGDKVFEQRTDREYGVDYQDEIDDDDAELFNNEEEDITQKLDYNDQSEEEINLNSLGEIKKVEEVKRIEPIKSISNVLGLQEIKNLQEIRPRLAERFIKEEKLKNIINEYKMGRQESDEFASEPANEFPSEVADEIATIDDKIDLLRKEIDVLESTKQELIDRNSGLSIDEAAETEETEDASLGGLDSLGDIKSVTPIKSIEEVKSIQPVKSIKEVVNLYALTAAQAQKLQGMVDDRNRRRRPRRH